MPESIGKKIVLLIITIIIAIQFFPTNRDNPAVTAPISAPDEVMSILKKSCYDCHSNQSTWPWYSQVAPVSWLVASHVNEGREHLNFSEWKDYPLKKQIHKADEIWDEVEEGEMPLASYLLLHGDAELSENDKAVIKDWSMNFGVSDSIISIDEDLDDAAIDPENPYNDK